MRENLRRSPHQGRCLGFLVAWLRAGPHMDRDYHQRLAKKGEAANDHISFEARSAAREWLKGQPDSEWLFAQERLRRLDEPFEEPLGVAY